MDRDSFIAYTKTQDIYIYTAREFERIFDTANYGLERLSPREKN